jgi:hypothetical protein
MDPFDYANLEGLRDYLHRLGFNKTYYGQLYHTWHFQRELCRIHQEDPYAHFVLIGFSFGANMARNIAQGAKEHGIRIDLLVYLGGNTLKNIPRDRPENVGQIINILASGCIWNGAWLDDAVNVHEIDVWHFGSPTHPQTLELLSRQLSLIACAVPIMEPPEPKPMPTLEEEPTPRPVQTTVSAKRDEWDFLKPTSRLSENGDAVTPTGRERPAAPAERTDGKHNLAAQF